MGDAARSNLLHSRGYNSVTTILRASPRRFVSTPAVERVALRALRYLQSGFSVHLRGQAGTGKTTLALHLADLLSRPLMLIFGDDEFKTSDLIGNQSGYTRRKVIDNFIHSVVKVEDELRQNWVDSRLTLACREGFTLVYDEFNRSRPEVNNVLLSALEEKLLVLPPSNNKSEYIRVHPQFRAIFTSNPKEYCGVHDTQDALMDRLITIDMPEPDELTQQEILVQKVEIDRPAAALIVSIIHAFRLQTDTDKSSGLRSALFIAKVCQEHQIDISVDNPEFRDVCQDILLSRANLPLDAANRLLWAVFEEFVVAEGEAIDEEIYMLVPLTGPNESLEPDLAELEELPESEGLPEPQLEAPTAVTEEPIAPIPMLTDSTLTPPSEAELAASEVEAAPEAAPDDLLPPPHLPHEQAVYSYLRQSHSARVSEIEKALGINRFEAVNAIRTLSHKKLVTERGDRIHLTAT